MLSVLLHGCLPLEIGVFNQHLYESLLIGTCAGEACLSLVTLVVNRIQSGIDFFDKFQCSRFDFSFET